MEYLIYAVFMIVDLVLIYGLFAQSNEVQLLKNSLRAFEIREARQSREVHVHHHGKESAAKGQGKAAVIPHQWRGVENGAGPV